MLSRLTTLLLLLCSASAALAQDFHRQQLSLEGRWHTSLGEAILPGTTDTNRLGGGCSDTTQTHALTRLYPYSGRVRYSREVVIPRSMAGCELRFVMERTKPSTLYIDGDSIGSLGHIYAPHIYNIGQLSQGRHTIDILIDNSPQAVPAAIQGSHAWAESTQTNWNGILGDIYIEKLPTTRIEQIDIYPDVESSTAKISLLVESSEAQQARLSSRVVLWNCDERVRPTRQCDEVELTHGSNRVELTIDMGEDVRLWSEFHPSLYRCELTLQADGESDCVVANFGMRHLESRDGALWLNGKKIFLRGKHDAAVFPLTGYPPMDVESWQEYLLTLKEYGINHIRCHSYTPPKAAFEAADRVGIYIQTELPLWGTLERKNCGLTEFMQSEGEHILQWLGNHPSFAFMALGNELGGEIELMRDMIEGFRTTDARHLYAMGANNFLGWQGPQQGEELYIACRNGWGELYDGHLRSSFAFVDAEQGGMINGLRPSTRGDYAKAVAGVNIPVVSHETGQFQIYPDYSEIDSYTGVLHPYNLKAFRRRLDSRMMGHQAEDFQQATGLFAVECYKADVEYALRTEGLSGYQLLDLQDYPGQGTALVGILDATMQSKGLVTPQRWREWSSEIVPLARFDSYCIDAERPFSAELMLFNYSEESLCGELQWEIAADEVAFIRRGCVESAVQQGEVAAIGEIEVLFPQSDRPYVAQLTLLMGDYRNSYRLWVYPIIESSEKGELLHASELSEELFARVEQGATLLLSPDHDTILEQSVGGLFTPDYWNYSMFKSISEGAGRAVSPGTLGILCDPCHPLFELFPTSFHSDWQWWSIARNSRPLILDAVGEDIEPIVQVVDNIERCHRLGILFEFRVGQGKIILSMTDLTAIEKYPEGRWWRYAIESYALSEECSPGQDISFEELHRLLSHRHDDEAIEGVENISDYSSPKP